MRSKEFYYTKDTMVKDLIKITPLSGTVLDAGSGKNKVWYNNIPDNCIKLECEIDDGCNFYEWTQPVNWVIGNPPFHEGWLFTKHALEIATNGIAFLGNLNFLNQFTPRRLEYIKNKGFYINRIHIVMDKRWYGRYYYIIFEKKENNFITWKLGSY